MFTHELTAQCFDLYAQLKTYSDLILISEDMINAELRKYDQTQKKNEEARARGLNLFPSRGPFEPLILGNMNNFFFHSVYLSVFGFLESELTKLGMGLQKELNKNIQITDIKGKNSIDVFRKYYSLVLEFEKPEPVLWLELDYYWRIRNLIVHNSAWFPSSKIDNNLLKKIESYGNSLTLDKYYYNERDSYSKFIFTREFIFNFLSIVKSFLKELIPNIVKLDPTYPTPLSFFDYLLED